MSDLVQRVKSERGMRGWSQRDAATAGGISNQSWSNFEKSGKVTAAIQSGVAAAFGWPANWSLEPPAMPLSPLDALAEQIEALLLYQIELAEWLVRLSELGADVSTLPDVGPLLKRALP